MSTNYITGMKVTRPHYDRLKQLIEGVVDRIGLEELIEYHKESLKLYTPLYFKWQCLWFIPRVDRSPLMNEIYEYGDDTHITTALGRIVQELGLAL